jgi:hypothetical protein
MKCKIERKEGMLMSEEKRPDITNDKDKKKKLTDEEKEKLMKEMFEQVDRCEGCPSCCHE